MKIGDRAAMKLKGIACPYGQSCKSHHPEESAGTTTTKAAVYFITLDDLDNLVDYPSRNPTHAASMFSLLKESGCAPLTHAQVAELRTWLEERDALDCLRAWLGDAGTALAHDAAVEVLRLGEVEAPGLAGKLRQEQARKALPSTLLDTLRAHAEATMKGYVNVVDPYVLATTKACPSCSMRSTHYHGHACHMISPATEGCPQCHVKYCYKCLSTEKENTVLRGDGGKCKCGSWHVFCSPIKTAAEASEVIEYNNGVPIDKRCGCAVCPDCRFQSPCEFCTGCAVCSGLLNPGPMTIGGQPWEPLAKSSYLPSLKTVSGWVLRVAGYRFGQHLIGKHGPNWSIVEAVKYNFKAFAFAVGLTCVDAYIMGVFNRPRVVASEMARTVKRGYGGTGVSLSSALGWPSVCISFWALSYCDMMWVVSWLVAKPHEAWVLTRGFEHLDRCAADAVRRAAAGVLQMRRRWWS